MRTSYIVTGMTCDGCVRAVTNAIKHAVPGAVVEVDLGTGRVMVEDSASAETVRVAIEAAGFGFAGRADTGGG